MTYEWPPVAPCRPIELILCFVSVSDTAASEVIWRNLDLHSVSGQHSDAKAAHIASERRQYIMTVVNHNPERRVGKYFGHRSFQLDRLLLCHRIELK